LFALFSSYSPQHAAPSSARRNAQTAVLVTGLTASLGLPAFASPAAAAPLPAAAPVLTHPVLVPAATTTGSSAVRMGSRGAVVADLQRLLSVSPDGVFGPRTRAAVLAFQRSKGLVPDGIVGAKTWGALRGGRVSPLPVAPPRAMAAPAPPPASAPAPAPAPAPSLAERAIQEAASHAGKPYRYGAAGPDAFDCSGFTQYVFGTLGVSLPHSSAAQYAGTHKVPKSEVRLGDLVFMKYGGKVSHVGIYAGNNTMWVARRSGTTITQQTIWTSDFYVTRVV
jgi:cell wall-associated NlpC family hydrolase